MGVQISKLTSSLAKGFCDTLHAYMFLLFSNVVYRKPLARKDALFRDLRRSYKNVEIQILSIMQKCSSNITSYNIHCILFRFQTVLIALKIYLLRIQYTVIASLLWNVSNRSRYSNHTFVDDIHMIKHDFAEKVIHIKYLEIIVRIDDCSIDPRSEKRKSPKKKLVVKNNLKKEQDKYRHIIKFDLNYF